MILLLLYTIDSCSSRYPACEKSVSVIPKVFVESHVDLA